MHKRRRNDDARAKLLEKGKQQRDVFAHGLLQEERAKDAHGARGHDGKEQADAQANVVVALGGVALGRAGLVLVAADAVPAKVSTNFSRLMTILGTGCVLYTGVRVAVDVAASLAVVIVVVVLCGLGVNVFGEHLVATRREAVASNQRQ